MSTAAAIFAIIAVSGKVLVLAGVEISEAIGSAAMAAEKLTSRRMKRIWRVKYME